PPRHATSPPSRPHSRPQRTTVVCAQVTPSGSPDTSRPSTTARTPSGMTPTPRPASGPSMHHHPAAPGPSPQAPARSQPGTCSKARHTGRTTPDSTPQTSRRAKHRRPPAPVPGQRTTGRCVPNDNHSDTGTTSTAVITTTPPDQEAPQPQYRAPTTPKMRTDLRGPRWCSVETSLGPTAVGPCRSTLHAPPAPKLLPGDASIRPALHNLSRRHQWIATFEV
ncbi:hypothetical protein HMPREF9057_01736, partial [Actinomyces sp. oral taxon 171 str. F0337]